MNDYIGRSALLKELERFPHLKTAESVVRSMPKADVVEVVRCKYCIHKGWVQEPCHGRSIAYCHIHEICIREDDFCSYGERKEQK